MKDNFTERNNRANDDEQSEPTSRGMSIIAASASQSYQARTQELINIFANILSARGYKMVTFDFGGRGRSHTDLRGMNSPRAFNVFDDKYNFEGSDEGK